eukprot:scaffold18906_cov122-Isochrysis_galbana.AAC.9
MDASGDTASAASARTDAARSPFGSGTPPAPVLHIPAASPVAGGGTTEERRRNATTCPNAETPRSVLPPREKPQSSLDVMSLVLVSASKSAPSTVSTSSAYCIPLYRVPT